MTNEPDPEPTRLARDLNETAGKLALLFATDVQIDAVKVSLSLLMATYHLRDIAVELARAAESVDPLAAQSAARAGEAYLIAAEDIGVAMQMLAMVERSRQAPRGSVYRGRTVGDGEADEPTDGGAGGDPAL